VTRHPAKHGHGPKGFPIPSSESRFSIAIALGGGAARGLAHVPMLEALDEMGLRPKAIAGTSMGSIVGAIYAAGLSGAEIRAHFERLLDSRRGPFKRLQERWPGSLLSLIDPRTPSLVNGETLFEVMLPDKMPGTFEGLKIPLSIVATDFYAQEQVVLTSGPLIPAVAASSALPGLIKPVEIEGRVLIDGGYVNPTPFDLVRDEAAITIGVDVTGQTARRPEGKLPSSIEAWVGAMQITFRSIVREKLKNDAPDVMIRPNVGAFGALDFYRHREIFAAAEPAKDQLKRRLAEAVEKAGKRPDGE
jgi:NTE family protein